jgi:ATP-dependent Zn protease
MKRRKEVVAYHEAGHAVADVFQEIPIKSVSIVPDGRSCGRGEG